MYVERWRIVSRGEAAFGFAGGVFPESKLLHIFLLDVVVETRRVCHRATSNMLAAAVPAVAKPEAKRALLGDQRKHVHPAACARESVSVRPSNPRERRGSERLAGRVRWSFEEWGTRTGKGSCC